MIIPVFCASAVSTLLYGLATPTTATIAKSAAVAVVANSCIKSANKKRS